MTFPQPTLPRRRFLTITAGLGALAALPRAVSADPAGAATPELHVWRGTAMGSAATIALSHPDAPALAAAAVAEIARLEGVFSLYRQDSALARLNRDGALAAAPPELLDCLSLAGAAHRATDGLFDPTVGPLWTLYAERHSAGTAPTAAEIAAVRARTGWDGVALRENGVRLAPGMALTLNGIAQGYVADRVADLLAARGLRDVLVDTGEIRALGGAPQGGGTGTDGVTGDWPVTLASGGRLGLRDRALASSAPLGTTFDQEGRVGHIIDPRDGRTAPARWVQISVSAPSAAMADALSTAGCLMDSRAALDAAAARLDGARIETAVAA